MYTFDVVIPWRWHLSVETCSSLCMSCLLYYEVHYCWVNILITRICAVRITWKVQQDIKLNNYSIFWFCYGKCPVLIMVCFTLIKNTYSLILQEPCIILQYYICRPTGYTTFYGSIFIHNMFDSSTCFGPAGPSSGASINCVLLVWYVKTVCCSVCPYVRWLWNKHQTYCE